MKKGFGIFFMIIGGLNFIVAIATLIGSPETASKYADKVGQKIFMGIGIAGLGYWMYSSSKSSKEKNYNLPIKQEKELPTKDL